MAERREAEADLRRHLPEVAEQLPELERAADEIKADPQKRGVVERIAKIVRETSASRLSPCSAGRVVADVRHDAQQRRQY
jgi:hypothetical protein